MSQAVLLLHGQPGSAADWDGVADQLRGHVDVLAIDRPGWDGRSSARDLPGNARAALAAPAANRASLDAVDRWMAAPLLGDLAAMATMGGLGLALSVGRVRRRLTATTQLAPSYLEAARRSPAPGAPDSRRAARRLPWRGAPAAPARRRIRGRSDPGDADPGPAFYPRGWMRPRLPAIRAAAALAGLVVVLFTCATAQGATLVGGREQSKISTAFFARGAHQGQVIISTRASTVKRTWVIVKYVRPTHTGGTGLASAPVKLQSTYYHLVGARVKAGRPPAAVRADLTRPFSVALVYSGSGSETIAYKQPYKSVCAGAGGFTDEQDDTVAPMSWTVRYVIDLDDLQSAVRGSTGTALVPDVGFYRSQSKVTARETLTRTAIDEGCNGAPTTFTCRMTYAPGPATDGLLSLPPSGGLEVGVPITSSGIGDCDPSDYTLGPSLWDSGATTAFVDRLGLVGGTLPADPYAPVKVSWPTDGVALSQGFIASPCQGDGLSCRDAFHWTGQVVLEPLG